MHHIFVEHEKPGIKFAISIAKHSQVTRIKFAHDDRDLIAFSSLDGKISICSALNPPRLLRSLEGHTGAVTGTLISCILYS